MVVPESPAAEDRDLIIATLRAYNESVAGSPRIQSVAILLKDERGATVGGLWGRTGFDWLFVEFLVVPEPWRGHDLGTKLILEAERIAVARGCCGLWLDTFEFQARGFYEKLGFTLFGTLEDQPVGSRRYFLSKRLIAEG